MTDAEFSTSRAKLRRIRALIIKETRQLVRDPSSLALGVALPLVLILLFGYALSLDVKNVPVGIVLEDSSAQAAELVGSFQLSPYYKPAPLRSMSEAEQLMLEKKIDGIVRIRSDFSRELARGRGEIQLLVHGSDANRARIIQSYVQGAVGAWSARQEAEGHVPVAPPVVVQSRAWFNETNESRYFLVPGLIVLVMTTIGALLTAMVMAREWERGTIEALFVTPVRSGEILLGKTIPYFGLGMVGLALCVFAAKFMFDVPLRGSFLMLIACSMIYVLVAVGLGLLISSASKNQLVASQISLIATFMPAIMLSGFLFDIRSMPNGIRAVTYLLPGRYYVTLLQTIFLNGDVWSVILPNAGVLLLMLAAVLLGSRALTKKQLE
jgi:ABC-2 type transport system permease protein